MSPAAKPTHHIGNPNCPACVAGRIHQESEWEKFHPNSRDGIVDGRKLTLPRKAAPK